LFGVKVAIFYPCGKSGDHPQEDLVKPGYGPDMKYKTLIILQ
jgi:hypothetical protein